MKKKIKWWIMLFAIFTGTLSAEDDYVLRDAALLGHYNKMYWCLDVKKADVNGVDESGTTALMLASYAGHTNIVAMLLRHGANVDQQRNRGFADHETALTFAAMAGHSNVVRLLLQNGAKADLNHSRQASPVIVASENGHKDVVDLLLANGVNLKSVASFGVKEVAGGIIITQKVTVGTVAIHCATASGHADVAERLIKAGINVDSEWGAGTPLMAAARQGKIMAVSTLLNHGADINRQDELGRSPLMFAALEGHGEVVDLLLKKGSNPNLKDNSGDAAVDYAKGHPAIVKQLTVAIESTQATSSGDVLKATPEK